MYSALVSWYASILGAARAHRGGDYRKTATIVSVLSQTPVKNMLAATETVLKPAL